MEGADNAPGAVCNPTAPAKVPAAKDGIVRGLSGELESLSTVARSSQTSTAAAKQPEKPTVRARATSLTVPLNNNAVQKSKELVSGSKRVVEARGKIKETRKKMDENLNMKKDVKMAIHECLEFLMKLLKESEDDREKGQGLELIREIEDASKSDRIGTNEERTRQDMEIMKLMEGHSKLLRESKEEMNKLKDMLGAHQELMKGSYASVAAGPPILKPRGRTAVHSVIVSSEDDKETGDQVLDKIREAVNAREEGMQIDKIRKAKDRKIIIGCGTEEEIGRVKEKLKNSGKKLTVVEIENKDPLVILRDVMKYNKDEEVIAGLRTQNKNLFTGILGGEDRMEVRYRRRTRNPLTEHIVLRVSPKIWGRLTEAGAVHIDLQRVRVADQSPLIQCARCLGYGHGKRFCRDPVDVCSHCGGPHLGSECPDRREGKPPRCVNCVGAKLDRVDHSAFSEECPVRRRWDALARATVQYC